MHKGGNGEARGRGISKRHWRAEMVETESFSPHKSTGQPPAVSLHEIYDGRLLGFSFVLPDSHRACAKVVGIDRRVTTTKPKTIFCHYCTFFCQRDEEKKLGCPFVLYE